MNNNFEKYQTQIKELFKELAGDELYNKWADTFETESEEEISSDLWKNEKSLFNNLEEIDETEESEDDEDLFNPSSNILPSQIKDKRLKDIQNEILSLTESKNQDKLDFDEE